MSAYTINNFDNTVLVVGPTYNHLDKLQNVINLAKNYELVVLTGNITYPNDGCIKERIKILDSVNNIIYNIGNYDYQIMIQEDIDYDVSKWLSTKPNIVIINFISQSSLIVTCGGILPKMNKRSLLDNIETSFVSNHWHKNYGGGFGYVISNNPLTDYPPQLYNFSCQIGNNYSTHTRVYAQEVDKFGLKTTILV